MKIKMSKLYLALLASTGTLLSPTLFAAEEEQAERVEVTGSRIKRTDAEGQSPVLTLDRAALEKTGLTSVGDILQQLSAGGKALNGKFNSSGNFGFPADGGGIGAGSAQVDLRHLESKRVLVLVDGKRWVNESSASGVGGSVDLNTIPMSIVERIEVLEDGASAIYGSDAISGVINVITRKTFDGVEFSVYTGEYDEGDGKNTKAEITLGGSGDKFSALFNASYNDQELVSAADRKLSRFPVPGTGVTRGSSGTPQGRFIFCDPNAATTDFGGCDADFNNWYDVTLNTGVASPVWNPNTTDLGNSTYHGFGGSDRFNFSPYNLVLTPSERKNIFTSIRYDVSDTDTIYVKSLYNTRDSVNQAAPEPIFIGSDAGTGGLADGISIDADNPFNPFGYDLVAGQNFLLIGRRPVEIGPRIFNQTVNTFYFGTGLEGSIGNFDYDLNYLTTVNRAEQKFENGINLRRLKLGLADPTECAAHIGCTPIDLFGGQSRPMTQEQIDWIAMTTKDSSEQKLEAISANLTGDLVDMWAGPLSFAAGFETRTYRGSFIPDQVRQNGESQDSNAIPTSGTYDVDELYVEFNVPLLETLDASVAVRNSDYSTFGTETTTKFGLRFQPIDDVVLRATVAEGFRAPFIGELYGLAQFGAPITDPCSNAVDAVPGAPGSLEERCRALGVPSGYEQTNPQITTTTGGNPDLSPESSDSMTVGAVYNASWAKDMGIGDRLDFAITYYEHEIDDAVQAPDAQDLLDACVNSGDSGSAFCSGIARTPSGQINRFDNRLANIGQIETSGWDLKINWAMETSAGNLSAAWQLTKVDDYKAEDIFGNEFSRTVGVEVNDSAIPEIQWNLQLGWAMNDLALDWSIRYIDEVSESCSDFLDGTPNSFTNLGLCSDPHTTDDSLSRNDLDATMYHDLAFNWFNPLGVKNLKLTVGLNNAFDEEPPVCLTCSLNGYDAGTYDAPGQFWYLQASYRM